MLYMYVQRTSCLFRPKDDTKYVILLLYRGQCLFSIIFNIKTCAFKQRPATDEIKYALLYNSCYIYYNHVTKCSHLTIATPCFLRMLLQEHC